jgi:hypothetical protein
MKRVILIHFKADEAQKRLQQIQRAGYDAEFVKVENFRSFAPLRAHPPDAFVIDQCVRPSFGKGVAAALAGYAATRSVPQVFVQDEASWDRVEKSIAEANPARTSNKSAMAGYSGTPLPKKMGIREGAKVIALGSPDNFEEMLGPLPNNAEFVRAGKADLIILFSTTQADLEVRFRKAQRHFFERTRISIAWPRKTSGVLSDLDGNFIRQFGLGMGWVDFKVFTIDSIWSGLLFAPQKDTGARTLRQAAP